MIPVYLFRKMPVTSPVTSPVKVTDESNLEQVMPVTSPAKVTNDADESNLEQVCRGVILFSAYDFVKPINILNRDNK